MAAIFNKAGEKVLILAVREAHYRGFEATNWLDLRVGFFLSLTDEVSDDVITGLTETIGTEPNPTLPFTDRVLIGVTNSENTSVFLGYTNIGTTSLTGIGSSKLIASDGGVGTPGNFWRPKNETGDQHTLRIIDDSGTRAAAVTGSQPHFVANVAGAGGYCTLLALRFQRANTEGNAKTISMSVKKTAGFSSDVLFTSSPTTALLQSNLENFPTTVQTLGPVTLPYVPDTMAFYWPFRQSRLRIHAYGIVKAA